jgi:riboflavin kinase
LTRKGLTTLRSVYQDLAAVFADHPESFELKGKVVSGLGEGKYYVGQEGYRRQFERKLGFVPYTGTLDVELDRESVRVRETLQALPGIGIEGFRTSERTFGPVKCFEAKLRGRKVGAALPSRTHRPDVVELVAPINLRKKLKLSNGSAVKIEVVA